MIKTAKKPTLLQEMHYQAPGLGFFPILFGKVKHLITWGKDSHNMSSIVGPDTKHAAARTETSMAAAHMASSSRTFHIVPDESHAPQILEATDRKLSHHNNGDTLTHANFIYTTDPTIALIAKPGDCPVVILFATAKAHKPLVGLLHAGRNQLDTAPARDTVTYVRHLGYLSKNIFVGIAPSINKDAYYVRSVDSALLQHPDGWQQHNRLQKDEKRGEIYLDMLGYLIDQLTEAGILPQNLQAYTIDTLSAANRGEGFSQRRFSYSSDAAKNGRFLVAAQLT